MKFSSFETKAKRKSHQSKKEKKNMWVISEGIGIGIGIGVNNMIFVKVLLFGQTFMQKLRFRFLQVYLIFFSSSSSLLSLHSRQVTSWFVCLCVVFLYFYLLCPSPKKKKMKKLIDLFTIIAQKWVLFVWMDEKRCWAWGGTNRIFHLVRSWSCPLTVRYFAEKKWFFLFCSFSVFFYFFFVSLLLLSKKYERKKYNWNRKRANRIIEKKQQSSEKKTR